MGIGSGKTAALGWVVAAAVTAGYGLGSIGGARDARADDDGRTGHPGRVAGARRVKATLPDGQRLDARVVGVDRGLDVAVLEVQGRRLLPLPLGRAEDARVGEWVLAVGSPFGLDHTVTAGVLSAKGRGGIGQSSINNFLQTDAAIN